MKTRLQIVLFALICFCGGWLAAQYSLERASAQGAANGAKGAAFQHGLVLRARKSTEPDFTKDTRAYGVEVLRDQNNGNLVYISETGSISVVPAK